MKASILFSCVAIIGLTSVGCKKDSTAASAKSDDSQAAQAKPIGDAADSILGVFNGNTPSGQACSLKFAKYGDDLLYVALNADNGKSVSGDVTNQYRLERLLPIMALDTSDVFQGDVLRDLSHKYGTIVVYKGVGLVAPTEATGFTVDSVFGVIPTGNEYIDCKNLKKAAAE